MLLSSNKSAQPGHLSKGASSITSRIITRLRLKSMLHVLLLVIVMVGLGTVYVINQSDITNGLARFYHIAKGKQSPLTLNLDVEESLLSNQSVILRGRMLSDAGTGVSRVQLNMEVNGAQWNSLKEAMRGAERQEKEAKFAAKLAQFPWKPAKVKKVDCSRLFAGDAEELKRAANVTRDGPLLSGNISKAAENCKKLKAEVGFIMSSLTQEEEEFPIAYSVLVFKDAAQVLSLLKAVYRPQNYYCIHVDNKSTPEFREAIHAISGCFTNIFVSSRSVNVRWGTFTVLEPELICMQDLWKFTKWKYFINLTGQEYPLRTNWELVRILKASNGANYLEGTRKRANNDRFQKVLPAPEGIIPTKGSVHITVSRDFVDFILHSPSSQAFLDWNRKVRIPDELFFASLNHNPHLGIRGTYKGEPETHSETYPFLTRYKNWVSQPCAGKYVHNICILTTGDLPLLAKSKEFFANKFYHDFSHVALGCLEERLYNHTRDEFTGRKAFDVSYYAKLPQVTNMVTKSTFNRTIELSLKKK